MNYYSDVIKLVPKLRYLELPDLRGLEDFVPLWISMCKSLVIILGNIIRNRNDDETRGDFIEIKFRFKGIMEWFEKNIGCFDYLNYVYEYKY